MDCLTRLDTYLIYGVMTRENLMFTPTKSKIFVAIMISILMSSFELYCTHGVKLFNQIIVTDSSGVVVMISVECVLVMVLVTAYICSSEFHLSYG